MDWVDDAFECFAPHSHRPSPLAVEGVRAVFAQMPIPNPDGSMGINFIADFGQGGVFDGGNLIAIPNGIVPRPDEPEFAPYKAANFNTNREGYFRYSIHAHRWEIGQDSSGYADITGDNSVVTLHCHFSRWDYVRNTIIHELGHNFGLRHGGSIDCNEIPNYNSVMNYQHQFFGLDETCDTFGDHVDLVNYSAGTRIPLNEFSLNENHGLCGPSDPNVVPIDWNNNGVIETNVSHDIRCPGLSILLDHDDFAALILPPASAPGGGAPPMDASNACPPPPTE